MRANTLALGIISYKAVRISTLQECGNTVEITPHIMTHARRKSLYISVLTRIVIFCSLQALPLSAKTHCLSRAIESLKKHDLLPFHLGSELEPMNQVLGKIESLTVTSPTLDEAIKKFPSFLDSENWIKVGEEKDFGTFMKHPEDLEGLVISALVKIENGPPYYKVVVGKVIRTPIKNTSGETREKEIYIVLQTPNGKVAYPFLDLYQTYKLNQVSKSGIKRMAQGGKTKIEQASLNLADYFEELYNRPRRLFIFPETHEEELFARGLFTRKHFQFHPLKTTAYFASHPHELFFWLFSWAKHADMERKALQGKISSNAYRDFLEKNLENTYKTLSPIKFLSESTYKPFSRFVARGINNTFSFFSPSGHIDDQVALSGPVNFTLGAVAFSYGYSWLNQRGEKALVRRRKELIAENQHVFLRDIADDPFLERVNLQLIENKISQFEAAKEAYIRYTASDLFMSYIQDFSKESEGSVTDILDDEVISAIFPATLAIADKGPTSFHLSNAATSRIIKQAGTLIVPPESQKPATTEQIEKHIKINYDYFIKRQLILEIIEPTLDLNFLAHIPEFRNQLKSWFFNSEQNSYNTLIGDYIEALMFLNANKKLSPYNLKYALLEALQFEEKFLRWNVFGATRVHGKSNLTLKDFLMKRLMCLNRDCPELKLFSAIDYYNFQDYYFPTVSDLNHKNLSKSHILTRIRKLVNKVKKGRYKKAAHGKKIRRAVILSKGGVMLSHDKGLSSGAKFMSGLGNIFIALDIFLRRREYKELDQQVSNAGKSTLKQFL